MEQPQSAIADPVLVLLVANLLVGSCAAVPLARLVRRAGGKPNTMLGCIVVLVGAYFVEGVALVMGMGIPVFSVMLALVWAIVLAQWLLRGVPIRRAARVCVYFSVYSSLPAVSFLVVPVLVWTAGGAILSPEAGAAFGIPSAFPWPVSTIAGFYATCALGALVLKTLITVGCFQALARRRDVAVADVS